MLFIISAAGPFSARPPTIGEIAATLSRLRRSASRMPGTASIGPMLMNGFDGHSITASALAIASSTPGAGAASDAPSKRTAVTLSRARRFTK